jgi:hypothetical protein
VHHRCAAYDLDMFSPSSVMAVAIRPWLWISAIGALFAFAKQGWWMRPPFLPIPDRRVMDWRVTTAYGRPDMTLADDDLLSYLRWRRSTGASSSG